MAALQVKTCFWSNWWTVFGHRDEIFMSDPTARDSCEGPHAGHDVVLPSCSSLDNLLVESSLLSDLRCVSRGLDRTSLSSCLTNPVNSSSHYTWVWTKGALWDMSTSHETLKQQTRRDSSVEIYLQSKCSFMSSGFTVCCCKT